MFSGVVWETGRACPCLGERAHALVLDIIPYSMGLLGLNGIFVELGKRGIWTDSIDHPNETNTPRVPHRPPEDFGFYNQFSQSTIVPYRSSIPCS